MSAMLFANKLGQNHFVAPTAGKGKAKSHSNELQLVQRRRFTLSAATPSDSDRAGNEVARWLSTCYSTFGPTATTRRARRRKRRASKRSGSAPRRRPGASCTSEPQGAGQSITDQMGWDCETGDP